MGLAMQLQPTPTDAQIIFSSLPSGVPKGMVACLANYLMIKNALPPDPAEAMVLDPACGPSSPIVPHIRPKFRGYAPELYCLGKHLLPCKKFRLLHIVFCSSAYACWEFCKPLLFQHSPWVIK